jgi:hypothetical protein
MALIQINKVLDLGPSTCSAHAATIALRWKLKQGLYENTTTCKNIDYNKLKHVQQDHKS